MTQIRVALFGIYYPMAMLSYFREAFAHREDIELWTCGPFTGNWIPWTAPGSGTSGMRLPIKYVKSPDCPLPPHFINIPINPSIVESHFPWQPDLSVLVDAGWHFTSRPPGKVVVLVETDPHVLKESYRLPRQYADITFCMQEVYLERGELYLPYAYSPRIHFPLETEKIYDACLIGLHYPQRDALVKKLRERGLQVYYDLGPVFDEYRLLVNQSRVGLNWSSLADLNARFFEIPAMKVAMVANRVPDAPKFLVDGRDFLGFDSSEEAAQAVLSLLEDEAHRKQIAENGYNAIKAHTYDARVQTILETAGLI